MNKLLTPILVLCMLAGLVFLSGCPKPVPPCEDEAFPGCGEHGTCMEVNDEAVCQCDEGWTGEFCDSMLSAPGKKGNVEILVKKKGNGKVSNNYACMAVLGRTKEAMYFTEITSGKVGGGTKVKTKIENYPTLKSEGVIIDTFYSRKGSGKDESGGKAGFIKLNDLDEGTYYLHVYDGSQNKYVTQVVVTENTDDDLVVAEVQPLGKLKITVGQSTIIGTELDSNLFMVFPPDNQDTLKYVLKKDVNEIPFPPLYQGRTSTQTNEVGKNESGTYYLIDVPVRKVIVVAYNNQFATKDGEQPYEYATLRKNILDKVRVSFK